MRVLFNLQNFNSNQIDGVGYNVKRIISKLIDYNNDIKISIYYPESFDISRFIDTKKVDLIKGAQYNSRLINLINKFIFIPIFINKFNFDVVYYPSPPVSPFIFGSKVISTINDLTPLLINRGQGFIYKWYYYLITLVSIIKSKKIITISESTKRDLIAFFPFASKKTEIVYACLSRDRFTSLEDEKYFLMVSTLQPGKNIENAIFAFNRFLSLKNDYKLVIVGRDGWDSGALKNIPKKLGIADSVEFTGYISEDQLHLYYKKCTAVLHVSLYEGFGLAPLEGMYFGKPSIVSNCSSLPEVVGETGLLVDPYDIYSISNGMEKICNPSVRGALIESIDRQLEKFNPDLQIQKFIQVLLEANGK